MTIIKTENYNYTTANFEVIYQDSATGELERTIKWIESPLISVSNLPEKERQKVRNALIKAKSEYGKAFEKLAKA